MDLNDKAQWFKDFNGGMVPILEFPTGDLIPESNIAAEYAMQVAGTDQGIKLIPDDPVQACHMRAKIVEFNSKLGKFWPLVMTRFGDMEKVDTYVNELVPWYE